MIFHRVDFVLKKCRKIKIQGVLISQKYEIYEIILTWKFLNTEACCTSEMTVLDESECRVICVMFTVKYLYVLVSQPLNIPHCH